MDTAFVLSGSCGLWTLCTQSGSCGLWTLPLYCQVVVVYGHFVLSQEVVVYGHRLCVALPITLNENFNIIIIIKVFLRRKILSLETNEFNQTKPDQTN